MEGLPGSATGKESACQCRGCKRSNFFPFYLPRHICNFLMRTVIYIYIYDAYLYLGSFYWSITLYVYHLHLKI